MVAFAVILFPLQGGQILHGIEIIEFLPHRLHVEAAREPGLQPGQPGGIGYEQPKGMPPVVGVILEQQQIFPHVAAHRQEEKAVLPLLGFDEQGIPQPGDAVMIKPPPHEQGGESVF